MKPDTFKTGQTNFKAELVSEEPAEVISCTEVNDLYEFLNNLIKNGKIEFKEYSLDEDYQRKIQNHIKNRIIKYKILEKKDKPIYKFCEQKFPNLINNL